MASRVLDKAVAHFQGYGIQHMDVPEWGDDGQPLRVFWKPMTMRERIKHMQGDYQPGDRMTRLIIDKLMDEAGKPIFTLDDHAKLMNHVDPVVVVRIAVKILDEVTPRDAEKN